MLNLNNKVTLYEIENIVGEGENGDYKQFLSLPTMFSKAFSFWLVKNLELCDGI